MTKEETISFRFEKDRATRILASKGFTSEYIATNLVNLLLKLEDSPIVDKNSLLQGDSHKLNASEITKQCGRFFSLLDKGETIHYCVNKAPKATKIIDLHICQICLALKRNLPAKTRVSEPAAETPTRSRQAYDHYKQRQAARLASGEFKRHCRIEGKIFTLLELPCVKATNQDPDKRLGCRFAECETAVNASLRAYLSMRPSQGDQKT